MRYIPNGFVKPHSAKSLDAIYFWTNKRFTQWTIFFTLLNVISWRQIWVYLLISCVIISYCRTKTSPCMCYLNAQWWLRCSGKWKHKRESIYIISPPSFQYVASGHKKAYTSYTAWFVFSILCFGCAVISYAMLKSHRLCIMKTTHATIEIHITVHAWLSYSTEMMWCINIDRDAYMRKVISRIKL